MLRSLFLYLSVSKLARQTLLALPFGHTMARRFVAGETLDDAINTVRTLNQQGLLVTLDHLGENVFTEDDASKATQAYLDMLDKIATTGVKSHASLKLTQLGLDISEDLCLTNMRRILTKARETNNFVRIDMEGSPYTERTLRVFRTLHQDYGFSNVGIVIQSYLYRSQQDMEDLGKEGANVRLCKGAYKEPAEIAFPEKADVDANYVRLMQYYLSEPVRAAGAYIGLATHDEAMIEATKAYVKEHNVPKDRFEFQMLYGIRSQLQLQIVKEGYKMRVYVPYGTEWYPYFMRRLAERPANIWFILKNMLRK